MSTNVFQDPQTSPLFFSKHVKHERFPEATDCTVGWRDWWDLNRDWFTTS